MTLAENLLQKLSDWRPSGDGRHSWACAFPAAGWTVRLGADKTDTLSCLVWELTLTRTAEPPQNLSLQTWATQIADRVWRLGEHLHHLLIARYSQSSRYRWPIHHCGVANLVFP